MSQGVGLHELRPGLCVEPWHDPVIDEVGHDPRSAYVETFWLPVLVVRLWFRREILPRLRTDHGNGRMLEGVHVRAPA